ncbi:hypothetical protein NEOLEDRAFT_424885 [Neolentinus lepideus HHB14362 ss-1]|uniref:DUF6593 domain-containing protein n=1 Tax=Neolentinus lepideus HHB14362 ss-1 TaxID=1314782 RepID=A0A165S1J3_9AGAM|nr:hypothetical protein NEOLEDRAFT_424885 [Neolentinus lepideus HHB14362 ss-1]
MQSPDFTHLNPLAAGGWSEERGKEGLSRTPHPQVGHCVPPHPTYGVLPVPSYPTAHPGLTSSPGTVTLRFIPVPNNHMRLVNCHILGPNNAAVYSVTSNDPHVTKIRDDNGDVAVIEWRSPSTMVSIRGGKKMRREDFLTNTDGKPSAQCMWWQTTPYFWTADDTCFYLYAESITSLPLAIVRASEPLFEIEAAPETLQRGVLEPALVSLIMIQWSQGVM